MSWIVPLEAILSGQPFPRKPHECRITEVNFSKHFLTYIWGQKCQETYYIIEVKRTPLGVTKSCLSQVTANGKMIYWGAWYLRSLIVGDFICWEGKWGPWILKSTGHWAVRLLAGSHWGFLAPGGFKSAPGISEWSMNIQTLICSSVRIPKSLRCTFSLSALQAGGTRRGEGKYCYPFFTSLRRQADALHQCPLYPLFCTIPPCDLAP